MRQARNLSNMVLEIMGKIHDESFAVLKKALSSYILQIDGTVDGDFAMIVVVRDSVSGFVLHSEKCFSESEQSITGILNRIKERFGIPSGTISDMHTDLGIMINRMGIKSRIKAILRSIPEYDRKSLYELESGFCSDRGRMEMMCMRRVLEPLMVAGSSGYGFPFSLRHFNFYNAMRACKERA